MRAVTLSTAEAIRTITVTKGGAVSTMAVIGTYGDITFQVSDETARTFSELKYTAHGRWAVHEVIMSASRSEFLGPGEGEIEFTMQLSSSLGIDPRAEMEKVEKAVRKGTYSLFMLGGRPIGQGEWYIERKETTLTHVSGKGKIHYAEMVVNMKEYF